MASTSTTSLNSYTVGIVGATGAVGKEIRNCIEDRGVLKVDKLRFFGSKRSAGKTVSTKNSGDVEIELFDVDAVRECDVVFLAVDGDFALAHAKAISEGDDGAVVIDNSVRLLLCVLENTSFRCFTLGCIIFSRLIRRFWVRHKKRRF
jgi:predicted dinucleotide-binding enzyme